MDDYYVQVLAARRPTARPVGRNRARAVFSLALWELTRSSERYTRAARFDPSTTGVRVPPSWFSSVPAPVGDFLNGDRSRPVVLAVCATATEMARQDRAGANVVVDLLLGAYGPLQKRRMAADVEAQVLRTAIRLRGTDEDPTVIGLAHVALRDHPLRWQTVDAVQAAVKVASAHGRFDLALWFCDKVDELLASGVALPPGREQRVERIEYGLWNLHQRSATLRRRLDAGGPPSHLRHGIAHADQAVRLLDQALELVQSAPGDAKPLWGHHLSVRRAELQLGVARHTEGRNRRIARSAARSAADEARVIAREHGLSGEALVPLIKVGLQDALLDNDGERASALLHGLHGYGWPLLRTLPVIYDIAKRRSSAAVPREVAEAVVEISELERDQAWVPAASDATRRRHGRIFSVS